MLAAKAAANKVITQSDDRNRCGRALQPFDHRIAEAYEGIDFLRHKSGRE